MANGQKLTVGQSLTSPNGAYRAIMQGDGNFVVYGPAGAIFATGTSGSGAFLAMQGDGNVVVYAAGRALWASGTSGPGRSDARLVMQSDGNLVEYGSGRALWASRSGKLPAPVVTLGATLATGATLHVGQQLRSPNGAYRAIMQGDGNFVIYHGSHATYATNTSGPAARLIMQGDGNLVLYSGHRVLFATQTSGSKPHASMQNDGNFVVYGSGRALWASRSGKLPAPVVTLGATLTTGATLHVGQQLRSPNGAYRAIVQGDGNFVIYHGSHATYATNTSGPAARLIMQGDGNLVLYSGHRVLFATQTSGSKPHASMQNDGNFVVYGSGRALWASRSGRIPVPHFAGSGTYRVGVNIRPGTYRTRTNNTGCYWERLRGFSGQPSDIITNNFTSYHDVVTILPGDTGFHTQDCGTWTADLSRLTRSTTAAFGNGTWIVGTDMAAGRWTAAGGNSCYWERDSSFTNNASAIISNDFGPSHPVVDIARTDAGFRTNGCGTWTKVG